MSNPCHHSCDWTDGDTPDVTDEGCAFPAPIRKSCEAPALPEVQCEGDSAEFEFDPETEEFTAVVGLYDQNCLQILDQDDEPITTAIN